MRLARHVLKNQDKLIAGITNVTHVEDDVKVRQVSGQGPVPGVCWLASLHVGQASLLAPVVGTDSVLMPSLSCPVLSYRMGLAVAQAAYVMCRGSRAQLKVAAEEVQRQIKIITSTRKKQHSMEVLDVLSRVKKVKDLPAALRCTVGCTHQHAQPAGVRNPSAVPCMLKGQQQRNSPHCWVLAACQQSQLTHVLAHTLLQARPRGG
jgi:hypothetical protein